MIQELKDTRARLELARQEVQFEAEQISAQIRSIDAELEALKPSGN